METPAAANRAGHDECLEWAQCPLFCYRPMATKLDQVRGFVSNAVAACGYELVDVELGGSGRQGILRIFIDQESGISHEDCERVSRQVGTILDVEDILPFSYTLEVSSPGLDRKLTRPEDFVRFRGRLVKVKTKLPVENRKVFRGLLDGLDSGSIQLTMDTGQSVEIPMDIVRETRLEVDWGSELHTARSQ